MSEQTTVPEQESTLLSDRRKREVFDEFVSSLNIFFSPVDVVGYLDISNPTSSLEDMLEGKNEYYVLCNFFGCMTDNEQVTVFKMMLPSLIREKLGAKQVHIEW